MYAGAFDAQRDAEVDAGPRRVRGGAIAADVIAGNIQHRLDERSRQQQTMHRALHKTKKNTRFRGTKFKHRVV